MLNDASEMIAIERAKVVIAKREALERGWP
jgi:hypothetical protein